MEVELRDTKLLNKKIGIGRMNFKKLQMIKARYKISSILDGDKGKDM